MLAAFTLAAAPLGLAQAPSSGGGESVGSLPSEAGFGIGGVGATRQPVPLRLVATGPQADWRTLILSINELESDGGGTWTTTPLGVPGMAALNLTGAVELVLDRAVLESGFTHWSLDLGGAYAGGALRVLAGDQRRFLPAGPQSLDLHLQQLSWCGLLDAGVTVHAVPAPWMAPELGATPVDLEITATAETIKLVLRPSAAGQP